MGSLGGLSGALAIHPDSLIDEELADACRLIQAARRLTETAVCETLLGSVVASTDPQFISYVRSVLAGNHEQFLAIFLDQSGRFIKDEILANGSASKVHLTARGLFSRALQFQASGMILAHNHPSGDCRPSKDDILATRAIASTAAALDLKLVDHLIVTRSNCYSFRIGAML